MSLTAAGRIDVRAGSARSVWPTPTQLLLLRAALWPAPDAQAAWMEWQERENVGALDFDSWNLLPLAWRNLNSQGIVDPLLEECRGFYRYHWARNQVRLRQAGRRVAEWQSRGITVVALKGVALLAGTYRDAGLRPMADTDLLVSWEQAKEVAAELRAEGWRPQWDHLEWDQMQPNLQCSFGWQRGTEQIDLHWHVLHGCPRNDVTREMMGRASSLQLDGVETLQLCPEDMLVHVCTHGALYSRQAPIRWLADATWILRQHAQDFDWARVLTMGRRCGGMLALKEGLAYAAAELRLPVPADVLTELRLHRASWRERLLYRSAASPDGGNRWIRGWNVVRRIRAVAGKGPAVARWRRVGRFLCTRWQAPSLRAVGILLAKKVLFGHRGTWTTDREGSRAE